MQSLQSTHTGRQLQAIAIIALAIVDVNSEPTFPIEGIMPFVQATAAMAKAPAAEETKGMATLLSLLRSVATSEEKARATAGTGEEKVEWLRSQLIGKDVEFDTPFGQRALTYADQTASDRSLRYIEDYLVNEVLPFYGEHARARMDMS